MKQYMNKFLTIVALLMLTTLGARAEQLVHIVVKPTAAAGTVTYNITGATNGAGGVCTLTVTPASGYYLTAENLKAVTTLNGGGMQTPRRRIDIDPGSTVAITATDASADPSKTTTYTFSMPNTGDLDVEVTADFQALIAINPTVTLEGWTYGEQPKTPSLGEGSNPGGGALTFTYKAEGATEFTGTVPTNAGTHTVKASVAAANKYAAGEATNTFVISKAQLTGFNVNIDNWTYGEQPKAPSVVGNLGSGAVTFSYKGESEATFSETVPTNAGNYVVKAVVAETANYLGAEATHNFTIAKAKAELWFDVDESKTISTPVNETPKWPVLHYNPQDLTISYNSSDTKVATVDANGNVKLEGVGTTTISASSKDNKNYLDIEDSYELVVTGYAYKLKIDGKVVTDDNRGNLFNNSVIFDGHARLTLTEANISGIESGLDSLEIYLMGESNSIMTEGKYAIKDLTPGGTQNLRILTDNKASLSLQSSEQVILGFDTITIVKPLEYLMGNGSELNEAGTTWAMIGVPLDPFVNAGNKNNGIDYQGNPGGAGSLKLTNIIIDNVLYTLHDTQTPGASDDGFFDGMVVLNSVVSDEDLKKALKLIPSTDEYAEAFKGLTIMVPPGSGKIAIKLVTQEGHGLCLNFGGSKEIILQTHGETRVDTIHYSCSVPTYVYIYHVVVNSAAAASNDHRIGPKPTVSTGVNGLSVSADNVDTPPGAQADYLSLSRGDIKIPDGGVGHIIVNNEKVTDLDGDAFGMMFDEEAFARRRAYGNYDITYIDLRGTSITGKEFSRDEAPFKDLPVSTFIYLPAGNIVSSPNMVVGSVCDDLVLGSENYSFECAEDGFIASHAVLERPFAADEKNPFYLPFAISKPENFGTFFEFDELKDGIVEMKKSATVAANTAYYLQAKEGGLDAVEESDVCVEPLEETPYSGLIGTYQPMVLFSDSYVYDNALKKFRKGNIDYASPFDVYLSLYNSESTLLTHWEGEPAPTAVEAVRDDSSDNDQWFSLDGRKLQEQPTRKGVYLKGGKKLIVK